MRPPFAGGLALLAGFLTISLVGCAGQTAGVAEPKTEPKPLGVATISISWADQNTVQRNHIYGYNVYRSTSPNEDFTKINNDLIVPSPEEPNPRFVTYDDWGLPMGETFYYYVEAVQQDGSKQKATDVRPLKITRKMTPEEIKAWEAENQKKQEKERAAK